MVLQKYKIFVILELVFVILGTIIQSYIKTFSENISTKLFTVKRGVLV